MMDNVFIFKLMDLVLQTWLNLIKDAFGWDHVLTSDFQRLVHPEFPTSVQICFPFNLRVLVTQRLVLLTQPSVILDGCFAIAGGFPTQPAVRMHSNSNITKCVLWILGEDLTTIVAP